jgi:alcohol-forming fatty acyl-CoA reductase
LRLGISDSDYEKLQRCSVIFHSAASVRFDDPLKKAILLNTRGTREICELARSLPNLKCFVHVSTAYIQPKNFHIEERLYQPQGEWRNFIKYAENLDIDLLDTLTMK